jgi:hypothetical protein
MCTYSLPEAVLREERRDKRERRKWGGVRGRFAAGKGPIPRAETGRRFMNACLSF